jgi:hypothetical protein
VTTIEQLAQSMEAGQPDAILVTEEEGIVVLNLPADPEHFAGYAAAVLRCDLVEHIGLPGAWGMWGDEEALGGRAHNELITCYLQRYADASPTLHIHGPVLITGQHGDRVEPLSGGDYLKISAALREIAAEAAP